MPSSLQIIGVVVVIIGIIITVLGAHLLRVELERFGIRKRGGPDEIIDDIHDLSWAPDWGVVLTILAPLLIWRYRREIKQAWPDPKVALFFFASGLSAIVIGLLLAWLA